MDSRHTERVGDQTSVLSARAAEAGEGVGRHVVTAGNGYFLDGIRHVFDGDPEEAFRHVFGGPAAADPFRQFGKARANDFDIEGRVLGWPEDAWEQIGLKLSQHEVGVGHGQRPTTAVGSGAGTGARRVRANLKAPVLIMKHGASASGDGVDAHHRHAHADT